MPGLVPLLDLIRLAFSSYDGVVEAGEPFLRWFLARPGLDRDLSWAAWDGDTLASSLFITRCPLVIQGRVRAVGIVDTVMTHPNHRRQGLARALLTRAIAASREAGLEALQLYTTPGSAGHSLYRDLGFTDWAHLRYWERASSGPTDMPPESWRTVAPDFQAAVRRALRAAAGERDGVPEWEDLSWDWRRAGRPPEMPVQTWLAARSPGHQQTLASAEVRLTSLGDRLVLSDALVAPGAGFPDLCRWLAQRAPLIVVADDRDAPFAEALKEADFRRGQPEAALVLPLASDHPTEPGNLPWFPLTESIIGV